MDEDGNPLTDDPEIAALLDFEPVARKCRRHDGWTPENQRRYILGLAETGNPELAAHPLGRTMSGAYKVRTSAGGAGFAEAWDKALALHLRRNPRPSPKGRPSRGEFLAGTGRRAWPAAAPAPPNPAPVDPEAAEREEEELLAGILEKYRLKVRAERQCRLAGRIVEADFYVRQLTFIEVALDLACDAENLYAMLSRGDLNPISTVATPMSVLLDKLRRDYWREKGEPDRSPLPELGRHDEAASLGEPSYNHYYEPNGGDYQEWEHRRESIAAERAEAQRLWEEKAARDAAAWAAREADTPQSSPGFPGEGDQAKPGGGASLDDPRDREPRP